MQFSALVVAVLASVAIATELPACGQKCFDDNFDKSGCSSKTDYKCLCASKPFYTALAKCGKKSCDKADQDKAIQWAKEKCQ